MWWVYGKTEAKNKSTTIVAQYSRGRAIASSESAKVYQLIAVEGLPVVRFGRSVRVSVVSLQKWVERRIGQSAGLGVLEVYNGIVVGMVKVPFINGKMVAGLRLSR